MKSYKKGVKAIKTGDSIFVGGGKKSKKISPCGEIWFSLWSFRFLGFDLLKRWRFRQLFGRF